jgi:predicted ester cyclase
MNVLEHWFEEVWNKRDAAAIDKLWVEDRTIYGLNSTDSGFVESKDAFKSFHNQFCSAFPDLHIQVEDALSEGDKTVVRLSVTGTHTGSGLRIQPTGKPVRFSGMCMAKVKDGKVLAAWNNFDFLSMYEQLK